MQPAKSATVLTRLRATGRLWNTVLVFLDAAVVVLATVAAYYARFEGAVPAEFREWAAPATAAAIVLYVALFAAFGQYRLVLRYVSVDTMLKLTAATVLAFATLLAFDFGLPGAQSLRPVPIGVLFIQAVLVFMGASGARLAARVYLFVRAARGAGGHRVLIVGAGSAGSLLLREIQGRPGLDLTVVGFLDDQRQLAGRTINGVAVLGTTHELGEVVQSHDVEEVLVAIPSASRDTLRRVLNAAADASVQTRVMPPVVIEKSAVSLRDLREVDAEDLLGREPTPIDVAQVRETVAGKVVAVTGAAGSIGSELCRQLVRLEPRRLLLMEIDESRLYELWLELERMHEGMAVMCLCDIRDTRALDLAFEQHAPELVIHAAAYKHVPLMEITPSEGVKTNVLGTQRVLDACVRHRVRRFVLISTDKAVAPVNVMGLTKSLAEQVMLDTVSAHGLDAVAVRFGNVLASRGSVVPIFQEQLRRGGPLTVTHPEVTRYFMTIPEAARLVLQAQAIGHAGEVFVLDMGQPVKIVDLARRLIALSGVPADIEFVGLRPGEKLHESLVHAHEQLVPTGREKIMRVSGVAALDDGFRAKIREVARLAEEGDELTLRELLGSVPD